MCVVVICWCGPELMMLRRDADVLLTGVKYSRVCDAHGQMLHKQTHNMSHPITSLLWGNYVLKFLSKYLIYLHRKALYDLPVKIHRVWVETVSVSDVSIPERRDSDRCCNYTDDGVSLMNIEEFMKARICQSKRPLISAPSNTFSQIFQNGPHW